jgi:hypothetical protein
MSRLERSSRHTLSVSLRHSLCATPERGYGPAEFTLGGGVR